jgi:EAL domain-containing protein (putative c-di-GMP-specific phosphodiesterase class I)
MAKTSGEMPTATISGSHRFLLASRRRPPFQRYGERFGRLSSPAGLHRRPWLARLRRALEEDALVLHYQPIVSVREGAVSHHEALVRLADEPEGVLVAPGAFLGAAERYGLILALDRVVLRKAVAAAAETRERVAVNLSALSTTDAGMLGHLECELARHSLDPGLLVVEVTETAAISDMRRARCFCEGVRSLGCAVALDDFGAGFGSFHYLKHLPFDYLKIDGHFIRALTGTLSDQLVVKALVDVARGMGKQTIAEFVGDEATLRLLASYGVDLAQGYAVGRPQPALHGGAAR